MAVEGLARRRPMCKVCEALSDERLSELTIDILRKRRSYREIIQEYQKDLDEYNKNAIHKIMSFNGTNLSNHKRHSDPQLIADKILKEKKMAVTRADSTLAALREEGTTAHFLDERYADRINLRRVMDRAYKSRLGRMAYLEHFSNRRLARIARLEAKVDAAEATQEDLDKYEALVEKFEHEQVRLISFEKSMQETVLDHRRVLESKGSSNSKHITYYFINRVSTKMEDLLGDFGNKLLDYVVGEVFREDKSKGVKVVQHIAQLMDASLMKPLSADLKAATTAKIPENFAEDAKYEEVEGTDSSIKQIEAQPATS